MGKRLVSLLTALALAVSAFASLTVAPAGAVVEETSNRIFFPFVPNGDEYGEMGPWYGTVTIQNPNSVTVTIQLRRANGDLITTADLQPFASKTWNSAQLFGDGRGGGVRVLGPGPSSSSSSGVTYRVFRGTAENTFDQIPNPCTVTTGLTIRVRQSDTLFNETADYTTTITASQITINWSPTGAEPQEGTEYQVSVTCPAGTERRDTPELPIAGVAKIVAPVASNAGRTSAQHESVTGYTALPREDVDLDGTRRLVFPIVQTNNGWNSVLHITNFDTRSNCSVTVTLYQSPSGFSDPSFGQFIRLLGRGETWHIDLADQGVPAGWVGQAWVSSDCDVAATVDRVKPTQPWGDPINMALTNQALPTTEGNTTQALPLVFQAYNGWNTGYSIANLSDNAAANVTINYYNQLGVLVGTDSRVIQPRAMEFVYRPATTDVNIGGFGSALVTSNQPVLVAVDSVKYTGTGQDVGQALGYVAQRGVGVAGGSLYMPLFQKQGLLSGGNDNSGVALFNLASGERAIALWLFDSSGALVAPTLASPVTALLPAHGQFIFYAPSYAEMPNGFQGSVLVVADGDVVGVSNNVNYDVQFDGSAAYNMPVAEEETPASLACRISGTNWVLDVDLGVPQSLPVVVTVGNNRYDDVTDNDGVVTIPDGQAGNAPADAVLYLDVNNNGQVDNVDVLLATATCPARQGGPFIS
jgi:hypothetical protein